VSTTEVKKHYSLKFEDRGRYLFAHIKAELVTLDIATSYWTEIAEHLMKFGHKKILVIEDVPEMISIAEVHQIVTGLSDLPIKDVTFAFVDLYAEHSSLNDFGILVSENRGISARAFETEEEAENWLLESS
jgi:hypothetical protein